jgi:hypothetical protein
MVLFSLDDSKKIRSNPNPILCGYSLDQNFGYQNHNFTTIFFIEINIKITSLMQNTIYNTPKINN